MARVALRLLALGSFHAARDLPGLAAAQLPGSADDCAGDCPGMCFAGHCLFDGEALGAEAAASRPRPMRAGGLRAEPVMLAAGVGELAARVPRAAEVPQGAAALQAEPAAAAVERLAQENAVLRRQLGSWHSLGAKIADREARIAGFLASRSAPLQRSEPGAAAQVGAGGSLLQEKQILGSTLSRIPRYALAIVEFVLAALIAFLLYEYRGFWYSSLPVPSKRQLLGRLGAARSTVEVSELKLGGLRGVPKHTCVCVSLQAGTAHPMKTRAVAFPEDDAGNASFLSFGERFEVQTHGTSGKFVISMLDQDALENDVIAWAELPVKEFVGMAWQGQDYHRLDLHVHSRWWDGPSGRMAGTRPYVAMRLRWL